jgi:dTDP-4-amino-4,6-dideoxygalactose transaminase
MMRNFFLILNKVYNNIISVLEAPYFGFMQGHNYISNQDISNIYKIVGAYDEEVILNYERSFSRLLGEGGSVSFASGRMGFYALMKIYEVGNGDEVIINGATCSVMVNAILRLGATPVYSDIDSNTFGSSSHSIKECLTKRTKMVVAQHSFGIPCDIDLISDICKKASVFLLEDCALTLGSKLHNRNVGTFGDAALFSTDHSKPINTITGGLIYTNNVSIYNKLIAIQSQSNNLSIEKQNAIWKRFVLERRYAQPGRFRLLHFFDLIHKVKYSLIGGITPFLDEDFSSKILSQSYPYPSKLPTFLAAIGLIEINRWPFVEKERERMLIHYTEWIKDFEFDVDLPAAYFDSNRCIVPLRIVWSQENGALIRQQLASVINISWIWFLQPIVATSEPLINFNYKYGECPVSEYICDRMLNLPTPNSFSSFMLLLNMISPVLKDSNKSNNTLQ